MACQGSARPAKNQVVQISTTRKPNAATEKPVREPIKIGDFHCGDCGLTLQKRPAGYHHNCPGPKSIPYQETRRNKCSECAHNIDGVCVETKKLHPDRDAIIDVGIRMAYAACPIGEWGKTQIDCPKCKATLFDAAGVKSCRYCGWRVTNRLRYTLNIDQDLVEFLRQSKNDSDLIESIFRNSEEFISWKSSR